MLSILLLFWAAMDESDRNNSGKYFVNRSNIIENLAYMSLI